MQIGILGPLEVRDADGVAVPISGARLRRLLSRLAADAGRSVSARELVDAVWPDDPPQDIANALQSLVSRLRRALGPAAPIEQAPTGYRLAIDPEDVDATAFRIRAADAHRALAAGDVRTAGAELRDALALFRGSPLTDADEADYAAPLQARWEDQRIAALADRITADLALGRAADVVGELKELTARFPLREQFADQLMTALVDVGRTADALAVYEALRRRLADELGADPDAAIQQHHLALLRGEAPTARSDSASAARRSNLRAAVSSFIGRGDEVDRVTRQIEQSRLATIVGPGGAGKTRLATEAGTRETAAFHDGVWLVELAPVTDGSTIAQAALASLGARDARMLARGMDSGASSATDRVLDTLAEADALLIVDNCEHLITDAAAFVELLLARCPRLRVLATSREPLGIAGESVLVIPPLGLPPADARPPEAASYPAVQLLLERGRAANAGFGLTDENVGAVVEIVRRLDGLPLAIELAAARLRVLPVTEIAARLTDRFRLLAGGIRTSVARHRTLYSVVEWSWELLNDDERLLAERLAVFPAGATEAAAVQVCADDSAASDADRHMLAPGDVPAALMGLVDKSLLQMVADGDAARYRMLETIREFGIERLGDRGELGRARAAHARHFAAEAHRLDPLLRGPGQVRALRELTAERDNIHAAIRYLADSGHGDEVLRLVFDLCWYWNIIGAHTDSATWTTLALDATEGIDSPDRVRVRAARRLARVTGPPGTDSETWSDVEHDIADLAKRLAEFDDGSDAMTSLLRLYVEFFRNRGSHVEMVVADAQTIADPWLRAMTRTMSVMYLENAGEIERLRSEVDVTYRDFEALGDLWGMATVLTVRAGVRRLDGDLDGAIADLHRALDLTAQLGASEDNVIVQLWLAELRMRQGEVETARAHVAAARAESDGAPMALERARLADSAEIALLLGEGRREEAAEQAAVLRARVPRTAISPMHGHVLGLSGASCASAAVAVGDHASAADDLDLAYRGAIGTWDQPLLASVGAAVAEYAAAVGQYAAAAELLGAASALRGADDAGDVVVARTRRVLGERLDPDEFEAAYRRGRALEPSAAMERIDPARITDRLPTRAGGDT